MTETLAWYINEGTLLYMSGVMCLNAVIYWEVWRRRKTSLVRWHRFGIAATSLILSFLYFMLFLQAPLFTQHSPSLWVRGPFMFLMSLFAVIGLLLLKNRAGTE